MDAASTRMNDSGIFLAQPEAGPSSRSIFPSTPSRPAHLSSEDRISRLRSTGTPLSSSASTTSQSDDEDDDGDDDGDFVERVAAARSGESGRSRAKSLEEDIAHPDDPIGWSEGKSRRHSENGGSSLDGAEDRLSAAEQLPPELIVHVRGF